MPRSHGLRLHPKPNGVEANGRMMAGMIPGGGKALAALIPRYRKILNGEMGEGFLFIYLSLSVSP